MDSARTVIAAAQGVTGAGGSNQLALGGLQPEVVGRDHHLAAQCYAVFVLEHLALHRSWR